MVVDNVAIINAYVKALIKEEYAHGEEHLDFGRPFLFPPLGDFPAMFRVGR